VKYLAFDLGASGGKMYLADFNGKHLSLKKIHSFGNAPISLADGLYWDTLNIYKELLCGIRKAGDVYSVGIDGFCNDYAFVAQNGDLLSPVRCYRDSRTERHADAISARFSADELYARTGNQAAPFNTLMQLAASDCDGQRFYMENAYKMLFLPDLLAYYLTGEARAEFTLASVSQLMNCRKRTWDTSILSAFGIPESILAPIIEPGTITGSVRSSLVSRREVPDIKVAAVCGHDTASAYSCTSPSDDAAMISSGTWLLCGAMNDAPIINEEGRRLNIANEGNACGKYATVKNIMGSWILQEIRKELAALGREYSFEEISSLVLGEDPTPYLFDVDHPSLYQPGDMTGKVRAVITSVHGSAPDSDAALFRAVTESMVMKTRFALDIIAKHRGKAFSEICVTDGGSKDAAFCSMLADVCGRTVYAGPAEASAIGNVLMQLLASGEISGLREGKEIIRSSFRPKVYDPSRAAQEWQERYSAFADNM